MVSDRYSSGKLKRFVMVIWSCFFFQEHINPLTPSTLSDNQPLEIPKELWLLIDHLFKCGMRQVGKLFNYSVDFKSSVRKRA